MPLRRALVRRMRAHRPLVRQIRQSDTPLAPTISAPHPPIKPSPGYDSPSHSQALRPKNGLQKYSTSKFGICGLRSQHFSSAALKLYTHGQVQGKFLEAVIQTLIKTFKSFSEVRLLAASNPSHAFGSLAKVASHVLEVAQNSRDVHVQVFSPPSAPPLVSRRAFRRTAPTSGWSIHCRLAQSSDGLRSKPWIVLQSTQAQVHMPVSGQKSKAQARHAESTIFVQFTASGELKPDAMSGRARQLAEANILAKGSVFQAIAEDANFAIVDVAKQPRSWTSFETLSLTIREKLLTHLRLSSLTTVLDMRQLELTLTVGHIGGKRYVQNIRLNPNGTVRTSSDVAETSELKMLPVLESHSAIEPAEEGPKMPPTLKVDSAKGGDSGHMVAEVWRNEKIKSLSREAIAKVGVDTLWGVNHWNNPTLDVENAFAAFDSACRHSDAKGFACLAGAATALLLLRSASIPLQGSGTDGRAYSIRLRPSRGKPRIIVELPRICPSALALALKLTSPDASPVQVTLSTKPIIDQGNSPAPDVNLPLLVPDEITLLTNAAELVIDRVSSATTFDSAASAASTLAEALLRFVEFRSSTVRLIAVHVDIAPSQEHGASAKANWKEDHLGVQPCDGYAQVLIEEFPRPEARAPRYKGPLQRAEDHQADEQTLEDTDATIPFRVTEPDGELLADRDSTSPVNVPAVGLEKDPPHNVQVAGPAHDATSQKPYHDNESTDGDHKAEYHLLTGNSCDVRSRIWIEESMRPIWNCEALRLDVVWDANKAPTADTVALTDIRRTLDEELSHLETFSFAKWKHVVNRIGEALPGDPRVFGCLYAHSTKYMRNSQAQKWCELQLKTECTSRSARLRLRVLRFLRQPRGRAVRIDVNLAHPLTADFITVDRGNELLMEFWETAFADVIQAVIANGDLSDLASLQAEIRAELAQYILASKLFSPGYRIKLRVSWLKASEGNREHLSEELGLEEEQHKASEGEHQEPRGVHRLNHKDRQDNFPGQDSHTLSEAERGAPAGRDTMAQSNDREAAQRTPSGAFDRARPARNTTSIQRERALGEHNANTMEGSDASGEHRHPQGDISDHEGSPGHARPFEELDTSSAAHYRVPTRDATSTAVHEESWGSEKHDAQTEEDDENCAEYHLKLISRGLVQSRIQLDPLLDGVRTVARISWKPSKSPSTDQLGFADLREMVEKELSCVRPFTFNSLGHTLRRLGEAFPYEPIFGIDMTPLLKKPLVSGTKSDASRLNINFKFSNTFPGRVTAEMRAIVRGQRGAQRGKTTIFIKAHSSPSEHIKSDAQGMEKLTNVWDLAFQNVIRPIAKATDCDLLTALRTEGRLGLDEYINNTGVLNDVRFEGIRARWHPDDTSQEHRKIVEDEGRKGPSWRRYVFLALGSNVGDRFRNIEDACDKLDQCRDIRIIETSSLYETEPMYVEDQGRFLNGVCAIETTLAPMDLLDRLQAIENDLGRVKFIDKGPRNIDLDIIAYDQEIINNERLIVPHLLMTEREFVLRPLCDLAIGRIWRHPKTRLPAAQHLNKLPRSTIPMSSVTPLAPLCEPLRALDPQRRTHVMSILNITPDSFSDGGVHALSDVSTLKATILSHVAAGATIIDIGGQSSRPNAPDVTAEEETNRILPAIKVIKSLPEAARVSISVDTYRASVAEAAINAGAHIINDISAGLLDPDMLSTIARLKCTYIMMHMRGTPATMQSRVNTTYIGSVTSQVGNELSGRLQAARRAGIRGWKIILDPGIGFAKTAEQNVELLRDFKKLRDSKALNFVPWLVGSSRKGFIGQITGTKVAADRVAGTAATVTQAVAGGADIVRVHDVEAMTQVVRMSDAMYRGMSKQQEKEEEAVSAHSDKGEAGSETETENAAAGLVPAADGATSEAESRTESGQQAPSSDEAVQETELRSGEAGLPSTGDLPPGEPDPNGTTQAELFSESGSKETAAALQPAEDEPLEGLRSGTESAEFRTPEDEAISDQEPKDESIESSLSENESIDAIVSKIQGVGRQTIEDEAARRAGAER